MIQFDIPLTEKRVRIYMGLEPLKLLWIPATWVFIALALYTSYSEGTVFHRMDSPVVVLLVGLCHLAIEYVRQRRQVARVLGLLGQSPAMRVEIDDHSFRTRTPLSEVEIGWDSLTELEQAPNAWVLSRHLPEGKMILPISCLGEEVKFFILQQVKAHGGKVFRVLWLNAGCLWW